MISYWHPMLVHYTIALLSTAVVLFGVAALTQRSKFHPMVMTTAYWNLGLGSLFLLLTVPSGFLAYYSVTTDPISLQALQEHRLWALLSAVGFLTVVAMLVLWCMQSQELPLQLPRLILTIMLVALSCLVIAAHKGGLLVFRYGLGVG